MHAVVLSWPRRTAPPPLTRRSHGLHCSPEIVRCVSQLNTWPVVSPVNASRRPSRDAVHHSGSGRMASPYPMGGFHLFPEDRCEGIADDGSIVRLKLKQLRLIRPRTFGACWLSLLLWRELYLHRVPGLLPARHLGAKAQRSGPGALAQKRAGEVRSPSDDRY